VRQWKRGTERYGEVGGGSQLRASVGGVSRKKGYGGRWREEDRVGRIATHGVEGSSGR